MNEHDKHQILIDLTEGFLDGELDTQTTAMVLEHAAECEQCSARLASRKELHIAIQDHAERHSAPSTLAAKILAAIPTEATPRVELSARARVPRWAFIAVAASAFLACTTLWLGAERFESGSRQTSEVVSAHIRSLMAAHLEDVATSDQHTVKPWFAGKVDFSPPVTDFATRGFALTGGRLEYLAGHPAAAVVYMHQAHIINLFVCPNELGRASVPTTTQDRGYQVIGWSDPDMHYWLVSDLNSQALAELAGLLGAPK